MGLLATYRRLVYGIRPRTSLSRKTQLMLKTNKTGMPRHLEIGPGTGRIPGFETLDVVDGPNVDYICDAAGPLPFPDGTFELIYASHALEHVPWNQTEQVLQEWARMLKPGGRLEVWVPDGLKICKAFVDAEVNGDNYIHRDGWYRWNEEKDPCKWAAGRIFTYGDGEGDIDSPNWHRAIFSARYLRLLLERVGLRDVREMGQGEVRGHDHGWINLGLCGTKP